jgi:hypothetical protein
MRHTSGSDGAFSLSAGWKIGKLRENLDRNQHFVKSRKCTCIVSQGHQTRLLAAHSEDGQ